jgi:hypothetical protein
VMSFSVALMRSEGLKCCCAGSSGSSGRRARNMPARRKDLKTLPGPKRPFLAGLFFVSLSLLFSASLTFADDASVLPKGRSNGSVENLFFFPTEKRWNPHGNPEKVADVFNEKPFLLAPGASAGDVFARFKYDFNILDTSFAYGLTDKLTLGIDVPYYWVHNYVRASLNSNPGSSATVGVNTGACVPITSATAVLPLTLGVACVRRFTTEDIQQLIGPGLKVGNNVTVGGLGFKRVQPFFADGLGDIAAMAKYGYFRNQDWRLAVAGGVRFPTGRQDDPNDLTDVAWSTGAWALLLRFHHDYVLSNLWKEKSAAGTWEIPQPGDLILDFTFRYDWVLPDQATLRIGAPEIPLVPLSQRERVDRNLGDRFEIEFAGKYHLFRSLSVSALYKYGWKVEDQITGHKTFPTGGLEKDSDSTEQIFIVRGTYSTLPLYLERKFPIPLNLTVAYRDRFAGSGPRNAASPSQYLTTRYISLSLNVVF